MAREEADILIQWGRWWFGHMWIRGDTQMRDQLIDHVNGELNAIGFSIGRGWRDYDPVVRRVGARPSTYANIAAWASRQADGGRAVAQQMLDWARGDDVYLSDLPTELQDLAIITHFAEVGRGYASALELELYPLLEGIVAGSRTWGDYREFSPSLKYAEDVAMDWQPE